VVEEVSLVDRAANKQRFLLVKRDNMEDEENKTTEGTAPADPATTQEPTAPATDGVATDGTATSETPAGQEGADGQAKAGDEGEDSVLSTAVGALEVLTDLVNSLGELGQSADANQRLGSLATSLAEIAQSIIAQVGEVPPVEPPPTEEMPPASDEPPPDEAAKSAASAAAVEKAKAVVEKLKSATGQNSGGVTQASIEKSVSATIDASLKKFQEVLTDVQQRIAKMEKSAGVPASVQPETVTKSAPSDVEWPMDLNAPTKSRESA
jgi:hypothetical protein